MKTIVEAINTPSAYQFPGNAAELRLYATLPFVTSEGQLIGQGSPILNESWYLPVACEIQPTGILYVPSFEIDSTTDGQPRLSKYIAALFTEDGAYVGPMPTTNPNGFAIPPPSLMPNPTWGQLAIYNRLPTLLYPPTTSPTAELMYAAIAAAISQQLLKASATDVGNTALDVDPTDPSFPIAVGSNSPLLTPRTASFYSSDYASLNAAVAAIGSTPGKLLVQATSFPSGLTCTVPSTLVIDWGDVGNLLIAAGQVVTFQSDASSWPIRKLFFGTGTVAFTSNTTMIGYYPQWWGAVGDNATDDAAAWNAMLLAIPSYSRIALTSRFYSRVNSTVLIQDKEGLLIEVPSGNGSSGAIGNNSMLRWGGAAGGTVLKILDSRGLWINGLTVVGTNSDSSDHASIGVDIDQSDPIVAGITTDIVINRCMVDFTNNSANSVCVRISETSSQNVESIRIFKTTMYAAGSGDVTNVNRGVCVKVGPSANAKNIQVVDCELKNAAICQYFKNGSFYSARNLTTQNSIEYQIEGMADPSVIEGNLGEGSRQFLVMPSGGGHNLTIRSNNFGNGSTNAAFPWLNIASGSGVSITFDSNSFDDTGFETIPVFRPTPVIVGSLISKGNIYGVSDIATIGFENFNRGGTSENDYIPGQGGGVQSSGARVRVINTTASISPPARYVGLYTIDATAGNRTVSLPNISGDPGLKGLTWTFKKVDVSANTVTISGDVNIDGAGSYVLTAQWDYVTIVASATGNVWLVVANN